MTTTTQRYLDIFVARTADRLDWCDAPDGAHPCGREACHGRPHWSRRWLPLDAARLRSAMESWPLSVYFLDDEANGVTAAIDIDGDGAEAKADRIVRFLRPGGISPVRETSRSGIHLWLPVDRRTPGALLRRGVQAIAQLTGYADDPRVELRPSSDHGLGGQLRAPGTISPKSGTRSPLCDADGIPLHDTLVGALHLSQRATCERWSLLASLYKAPPPPPARPPREFSGESSIERFKAEHGVAELLAQLGAINPRPGRSVRCVAPGHTDHHPSLSILADDQRAICHSPGCAWSGRGIDAWDLRLVLIGAPAAVSTAAAPASHASGDLDWGAA